jgi:predicted Fe-S protein YdhL (DUF1289 family)
MIDLNKTIKQRPARPMSPCISVCTLDEALTCMGCRRSLDEIRHWAKLSGPQQWALVKELRERQEGLTPGESGS